MSSYLEVWARFQLEAMPKEHRPCMCNVTTCQYYNGDPLDYNCSDDAPFSIISMCPTYQEHNREIEEASDG
jgi:hypothetical protein